jgi:hypothetical protein
MNEVDTLEPLKGWTCVLYHDEDASHCDPRGNDNLGKMYCLHKRYELGDKHPYKEDMFTGWKDFLDTIMEDEGPIPWARSIYMIDHSGIALSIRTSFSDCDPGHWDSGQVGWAFITAKQMVKEYGPKWNEKQLQDAANCVDIEVQEYSKWCEGEVYGYIVRDPEGKHQDSCWGFIGLEWARQAAQEALRDTVSAYEKTEAEVQALIKQFAL